MIMNAFLPAVQMSGDSLEWLITGQSIPSVYVNSTVSSITAGAFAYHNLPSELNFPECTSIGSHAFEGVTNLEKVMSGTNPFSQVQAIGDYAFAFTSCLNVWNTNGLPSCTTIGSHAFEGFKGVMPMPQLVTIGDYAFYQGWLRSEQSPFDNVVTIGNYAFASFASSTGGPTVSIRLSNFNFPSCISIGSYAFHNTHYALNDVSLPLCTDIGPYAFYGTRCINSIYAPKLSYIPEGAFMNASLGNVGLEFSYVSYIGSYAFNKTFFPSNTSTTSVTFSFPACTMIDNYAFADLASGVANRVMYFNMNCPNVLTVGISAFSMGSNYAARLVGISFPQCTSVGSSAFYRHHCSTIDMPELLSYGLNAFNGAALSTIKYLSLPKVSSITASAFMSCSSLSFVNILSCKQIAESAFYGCSLLTSIIMSKMQSIGTQALTLTQISTINIPQCLSISGSAFSNCTALESISCLGTYIGGSAFNNCTSLSVVNLTDSSRIYAYAFQSCKSMNTIAINYTGTGNISSNVFRSCFHLLSVYLLGSKIMPLAATNAFISTPISTYTTSTGGVRGSIFVPSSLYATYSTSTNWATYAARFVSLTDEELASAKARFGIT